MDSLTHGSTLNHDILLAILSHLAVRDLLAMRQVCRMFRDLTHERSVWTQHYAEMVRDRQLPTPLTDHNLSQHDMETAVRRNDLVESAWRRANPKMDSLRFVTLLASQYNWVGDIRKGFMVPGGRYFLMFTFDGVYILSLEGPSQEPVSFINTTDVDLEGLVIERCSWNTGRPDDGSLTLYVAIESSHGAVETGIYAFWSANFQVFPPTQTYHGQSTIPGSQRNIRTRNDLLMFSTANSEHILVFDWRALLQRDSFRHYAIRIQDRSLLFWTRDLQDFCLLQNGSILAIYFDGSTSLCLFPPPEFQIVQHLNQPLPTKCTAPLWQYHHPIGSHICNPYRVWSIPLCHPHTNVNESSALIYGFLSGCCYRVDAGSEGPNISGHQIFPAVSNFLPGRTRALAITPLDNEDGLRIGCLSYAPEVESRSLSPQPYGTFDLSKADVSGREQRGIPGVVLNTSWVYFDEESGRMCFLLTEMFPQGDGTGVFVLDFV